MLLTKIMPVFFTRFTFFFNIFCIVYHTERGLLIDEGRKVSEMLLSYIMELCPSLEAKG